jgi:hypothetical protein
VNGSEEILHLVVFLSLSTSNGLREELVEELVSILGVGLLKLTGDLLGGVLDEISLLLGSGERSSDGDRSSLWESRHNGVRDQCGLNDR